MSNFLLKTPILSSFIKTKYFHLLLEDAISFLPTLSFYNWPEQIW